MHFPRLLLSSAVILLGLAAVAITGGSFPAVNATQVAAACCCGANCDCPACNCDVACCPNGCAGDDCDCACCAASSCGHCGA